MIPEIGHFALILSALVALVLGTLPLIGAHQNRMAWVAVARPAATAMALLITFSFACLTQAFVASDFSVVYVAQHSNSLLPIQYRVAAVSYTHLDVYKRQGSTRNTSSVACPTCPASSAASKAASSISGPRPGFRITAPFGNQLSRRASSRFSVSGVFGLSLIHI